MKRILLATGLTATALLLAGCSSSPPDDGRIHVVAGLYPYAWLAEQIGGDRVTVQNLTAPGAEPHDLELTARQVADIGWSDLTIYEAGMQPAVDEAVAQAKPAHSLDVTTVVPLENHGSDDEHDGDSPSEGDEDAHDHGSLDPHIWLDAIHMETIATSIADLLTGIEPSSEATFTANLEALRATLSGIDQAYSTGLATCERRDFITTHSAFGYLAERYNLNQIGISGLSPDEEPSPARIADIQKIAISTGVTTIFFETLVSPDLAESIASDLHLRTDILDPLEGVTPQSRGNDYPSIMAANLTALQEANSCS